MNTKNENRKYTGEEVAAISLTLVSLGGSVSLISPTHTLFVIFAPIGAMSFLHLRKKYFSGAKNEKK